MKSSAVHLDPDYTLVVNFRAEPGKARELLEALAQQLHANEEIEMCGEPSLLEHADDGAAESEIRAANQDLFESPPAY